MPMPLYLSEITGAMNLTQRTHFSGPGHLPGDPDFDAAAHRHGGTGGGASISARAATLGWIHLVLSLTQMRRSVSFAGSFPTMTGRDMCSSGPWIVVLNEKRAPGLHLSKTLVGESGPTPSSGNPRRSTSECACLARASRRGPAQGICPLVGAS